MGGHEVVESGLGLAIVAPRARCTNSWNGW